MGARQPVVEIVRSSAARSKAWRDRSCRCRGGTPDHAAVGAGSPDHAAVRAERPTISVAGGDVPCSFAAYRRRRCLRTRLAGMYSTQALCGSSLECPRTCRSNQSGRRARSLGGLARVVAPGRRLTKEWLRAGLSQRGLAVAVLVLQAQGPRWGDAPCIAAAAGSSPLKDQRLHFGLQHSEATFGHLVGSVPPGPQAGRGQVLSNRAQGQVVVVADLDQHPECLVWGDFVPLHQDPLRLPD